jgi:hypothetical protein
LCLPVELCKAGRLILLAWERLRSIHQAISVTLLKRDYRLFLPTIICFLPSEEGE